MKTVRELAQQQLDLMEEIRYLANINMVTCGNCGTILLHDMKPFNEDNKITCFGCKSEMELSDCPDYWYEGCIENSEFDELNTISSYLDVDDVIKIATSLDMNPDIDVIGQVLRDYDSEFKNDPTATWELIVENLLYNNMNLSTWYEVYRYDEEEGTETIASFDTKKQALDFMFDYSSRNPDIELNYDVWQSNADGSGVAKRNPVNNKI